MWKKRLSNLVNKQILVLPFFQEQMGRLLLVDFLRVLFFPNDYLKKYLNLLT